MKFLIAALLGFAIIGGACDAMAGPVVVLSTPGVAKAVDGVIVGGTDYDVSFVANAIDSTFDGQSSLAAPRRSANSTPRSTGQQRIW